MPESAKTAVPSAAPASTPVSPIDVKPIACQSYEPSDNSPTRPTAGEDENNVPVIFVGIAICLLIAGAIVICIIQPTQAKDLLVAIGTIFVPAVVKLGTLAKKHR